MLIGNAQEVNSSSMEIKMYNMVIDDIQLCVSLWNSLEQK